MKRATRELANESAAELTGLDRKPPAEQLAKNLAIGQKREAVIENTAEYGLSAVEDVVARVPQLKSEENAYATRNLSCLDDELRNFLLKATGTPMGNGQSLTPTHWLWLLRHHPSGSRFPDYEWLGREIAWLRQESPSATVLKHVDQLWEEKFRREADRRSENLRTTIGILEDLQRSTRG